MVHICVSRIDWVDYFTVLGKYIDAEKNGTVWAHEGYLHPHSWKWAIPTRQVGSGRGTSWPWFVKSPLARGEMSDWVIPGKLYSGSLALWSVYDDKATHVTRNVQYLDIHHSCFGVWVPYNASLGIELPHGAVKGGWLPSGSPLYVAQIFHDEKMRSTFAYYNPSVSKAIGTVGGTFTRTIMDILVLKWLNCLIHEQLKYTMCVY